MAFPIPPHLPRRAHPQDVPSQILSKIDAATNRSLNSALAASWLAELEETIQLTEERIHDRIQADLPKFEQQLASSKSVHTRLQSLTSSVDALSDSVSNPETGIIPLLITNLTRHAALAQEWSDANVAHKSLSHLLECRIGLNSLETIIEAGRLSDAVQDYEHLQKLFEEPPVPLRDTNIMTDMKRRFHAAKARTEEQLSDAYSRSVVISPNEITIYPSAQVRHTDTVLSLSSIVSSLSPSSLSNHLTALRRDITTHFIDHVLKQPSSVTTSSGASQYTLSRIPSPTNEEIRTTRLENLSSVLDFLSAYLFPSLPPVQGALFKRSLCKPIATSLLDNLLIPALPPSFGLLPLFLELVRRSVAFEEKFIVGMLGHDSNDGPVKAWADGVSGHYERRRRLEILESSRIMLLAPDGPADSFRAEVEVAPEPHTTVVPVQVEDDAQEDAWGFDEDVKSPTATSAEADADGWGFDDEIVPDEPAPLQPEPPDFPLDPHEAGGDDEPDPADAWGWNDDEDLPPVGDAAEETAWDDPWTDAPSAPASSSDPRPPRAPSTASPRAATRLEKIANKGKKHPNGNSSRSPVPPSPPASAVPTKAVLERPPLRKRPSKLVTTVPKESYTVSGVVKRITGVVEDALNEGRQFSASSLFYASGAGTAPGTVILQTASSVLELYRALYPVKFARELASPERGMRFSNDCLFLSLEVARIEDETTGSQMALARERLSESRRHLRVLSDSWYHDTLDKQRQSVDGILTAGTRGFTYTGDQDRFDECEGAITRVLQEIRGLAQRLKGVLTKSRYYTAIGLVAEAALARILEDVLALPDIPEVESHRIGDLCRILNALEGLFVADSNQSSFVVAYVPSWLKFSYLSELLEASMADITYLFEEEALVDFEVEELVRLVRALFADTQLRTNTINKLLCGHPIPAQ